MLLIIYLQVPSSLDLLTSRGKGRFHMDMVVDDLVIRRTVLVLRQIQVHQVEEVATLSFIMDTIQTR
jgi:hypothetical protein